jgi:uncharacterized protein (DUF736 family)
MSEPIRPNFVRNSTAPVTPVSPEIQERRSQRAELGAVWKRTSKANMEYMTIRLKLTREKLQALLASPTNDRNEVEVDLVAFANQNQEDNPRRPSYRVYEELS